MICFYFVSFEFDGILAIDLVITNEPKKLNNLLVGIVLFPSIQISMQLSTYYNKSAHKIDFFLLSLLLILSFLVIYRVLKAPGGGSSDIFGGSIPSTPRSVKNNMASNIFGGNGVAKNGNGKKFAASSL